MEIREIESKKIRDENRNERWLAARMAEEK